MSTEAQATAQDTANAVATATSDQTQAAAAATATDASKPAAAAATENKNPAAAESSKAEPDKHVVPEKYDLKLPEGALVDKSRVEEISNLAREKGLSNEQAQDLLNRENDAVVKYHNAQQDHVNKMREEWKQQVLQDKELGGDNLNKNVELAHRALKEFGSPALREQLETTGLGNHPELVRMLSRVGKIIGEDKIIQTGNSSSMGRKSLEEVLYNNTKN